MLEESVEEMKHKETLSLLGVSVKYLSTTFMDEVRSVDCNESSAVHGLAECVIKQKGANKISPMDNRVGASYVHSLIDSDENDAVNKATLMLSYPWSSTIGDIISTLTDHCTSHNLDQTETYVWICCLCVNQHRVSEKISPEEFEKVFYDKVKKIGCVLAIMSPWQSPAYVSRVWCLFELFSATNNSDCCNFMIAIPKSEKEDFIDGVWKGGQVTKLFQVLTDIDVRNAKASVPLDKEYIMNLIEMGPGYDEFNVKVSSFMRNWAIDVVLQEVDTYKGVSDLKNDKLTKARYGDFLNKVGILFQEIREFDKALIMGENALQMNDVLYGRKSEQSAMSLYIISNALYMTHKVEKGIILATEALSIRDMLLNKEHEETANSMFWLACMLRQNAKKNKDDKKLDEALDMLNAALKIRMALHGEEDTLTALFLFRIGNVLSDKLEYIKSLEYYRRALYIQEEKLPGQHPNIIDTKKEMALVLSKEEQYEEALKLFSEVLPTVRKLYGDDSQAQWIRKQINKLKEKIRVGLT